MPDNEEVQTYGDNNEDLPEDLQNCLKFIIDHYEKEDGWVRKQQIKLWKKNDEFWHGIQFIFWSESRQDWISPIDTRWFQQEEGREEAEGPFYDFVANIYRAHGESIIAALGAQVPGVRFPPDDAENDNDLSTSQVYNKIADLIQRHNRFKILFLRALFYLWNQGLVFAYHAPRSDKVFGEINIPNYEDSMVCDNCGSKKELEPEDEAVEGLPCPDCGQPMHKAQTMTGSTPVPKSRVMIDLYGPLFVKVSYQISQQKETPYLILNQDRHKAFLKHIFPHCSDAIDEDRGEQGLYERMARTPSSYSSYNTIDENRDMMTHKRCWLRYWAFEVLGKEQEKEKKQLQKLFPNGARVEQVGTKYACSRNEDLDKYWKTGQCGLTQFIHSDPMGQPLIPIQEMTNVHLNLTQETIEHGIPSSFADSRVLNFEVYARHEARPGMVYPARAVPGQRLGDSFYESSRATLSKEVAEFASDLEKLGQFVSGSFPSIYGGAAEGKSRTASEYNMSRQMALQRLSIAWALISDWVARLLEGCVHQFVENMIEDERYVVKNDDEKNYVNVWIRRAEMQGKVGEVESEASETFPLSIPQKRQMFMQLFELGNEDILQAIFDPANRKLLLQAMGESNFRFPGEIQRMKQAREIQQMLRNKQPVAVDPVVDDSAEHIRYLREYLADGPGLELKETDPMTYQILEQHLIDHVNHLKPPPSPLQISAPKPNGAPAIGAQ